MNDKQIIEQLLDPENRENVIIVDDFKATFEMVQLGTIPMHGVIYAVLDLVKIDGEPIAEEDAGLVILELDFDSENDEYYVTTVEDDTLFDEVIESYEALE
jgi:hypothetical protein